MPSSDDNNEKKSRIFRMVDFAAPADHRVKIKESVKRDKYLDLARKLRKLWNLRVTIIPIVIGALGTIPKGLKKDSGKVENRGMNRDNPDYCIIEIGENTGDLKTLAATKTLVKDHQLTLVFDRTNKWYMHHPAPVLENNSHKLLWDFNIQTDQLIPTRRPDLIIINKKKREFAKLSTLLSRRTTE